MKTRIPNFAYALFPAILGTICGAFAIPAGAAIISAGDNVFLAPSLNVGNVALGSILVNGGSVLDATAGLGAFDRMTIGAASTGDGAVTVTGAGSKLVTTGPATQPGLTVGGDGKGKLVITGGASAVVNRLDAAQSSGGTGTASIFVQGAGSAITSSSTFNIGTSGSGSATPTATAEISSGGVVNAETSIIGSGAGSNGHVTVSGAGSALNLITGATPAFSRAFLGVGAVQQGRLDILDGAKVTLDAAPVGTNSFGVNVGGSAGGPAGASGLLNIDGSGSELRLKGTMPSVQIGRGGTGTSGTMNVTGGGKLIVEDTAGPNSTSFVGRAIGGSGTANVTGAGSEWQAGQRLRIGQEAAGAPGGTGVVNVADGGIIRAPLITIGAASPVTGGGGTLTGNGTLFGNVTNNGIIAPGNSPGVMTVNGNVTLNPAGTVEIELGGNAPLQYDQLNAYDDPATAPIEGKINVGGHLEIVLFGGYNPLAGSFFDVFTALDIMELAPIYDLPALSGGRSWQHEVVTLGNGREALRLTVVGQNLPEPGGLPLLALGVAALLLVRRGPA